MEDVYPVLDDEFDLGPMKNGAAETAATAAETATATTIGDSSDGDGIGSWNVQIFRSITSDSAQFEDNKSKLLHSRLTISVVQCSIAHVTCSSELRD